MLNTKAEKAIRNEDWELQPTNRTERSINGRKLNTEMPYDRPEGI